MTDDASVTVVGQGAAAVEPTLLRVHLGVETLLDAPAAALDACAQTLAAVRAALHDFGVEPRHLQTAQLSLQPEWNHMGGSRPRLVGYVARTAFVATLAHPDRLGATLSRVVEAGGDAARIHGIEWSLSDPGGAEASAREAAFADARRRAEQYAVLAGRSLGQVVRVTEQTGWDQPPRRMARAAVAFSAGFEGDPGEVDVVASVAVTWELA